MKPILWISAACVGVAAGVAVSLLIAHKSPGAFVGLLLADPGIFFLLALLGAECAMLANDIAASKGWKGFNEIRMYPGADTPTGPPMSLHTKLFVIIPALLVVFC